MTAKRIALVIMTITVSFVIVNTIVLNICIRKFHEMVSKCDFSTKTGESEFYSAAEYYKKRYWFISLTVNHNDLGEVEGLISEIRGYIEIADKEGATVTKSRLVGSIEHLRRLVGINIDGIV